MNKLAQQIQEYVEIHALVKRYERTVNGIKERNTFISVYYPDPNKGQIFNELFPTPDDADDPKQLIESGWNNNTALSKKEEPIVKELFKKLARRIYKEVTNQNDFTEQWKVVKVVYETCPDMICGDNPCSCEGNWKDILKQE